MYTKRKSAVCRATSLLDAQNIFAFAVQTVMFFVKHLRKTKSQLFYGELPVFLPQLLAFFDDRVSLNCQALPSVSCDPVG